MKNEILSEKILSLACKSFPLTEQTEERYAHMKYPKLIPMMRFTVHSGKLAGFGSFMTMDTVAMGGLMTLSTVVLTPGEGADVPFLLIDTMKMKKKALAYVEFYDCRARKTAITWLESLSSDYTSVPQYAEKDAWYVSERTPYALIKGGKGADAEALYKMVLDAAKRYFTAASEREKNNDNLKGLLALREMMCEKGNPAMPTLQRLFGKEGAKEFFCKTVMPL